MLPAPPANEAGKGRGGKLKTITVWIVAMHNRLPSWVIHVISSVRKRLPLITHLRTYRCVAARAARQPTGRPAITPAAWRRTLPSCRGRCAERTTAPRGLRAAPAVALGAFCRMARGMPHQGHWCYPQRYPSFDAVGNKCTKSLILLVSRLGLEPRTP